MFKTFTSKTSSPFRPSPPLFVSVHSFSSAKLVSHTSPHMTLRSSPAMMLNVAMALPVSITSIATGVTDFRIFAITSDGIPEVFM